MIPSSPYLTFVYKDDTDGTVRKSDYTSVYYDKSIPERQWREPVFDQGFSLDFNTDSGISDS